MFSKLIVIEDPTPRSGPLNMAIDEVLLSKARCAILRFYRWNTASLSFGYFVRFADASAAAGNRAIVRRWTGGGIVPHGEDLTYSIIVPASDPICSTPSNSIYESVHQALCQALIAIGDGAGPLPVAALYERRTNDESAVTDRRYNHCFANPVHADVMLNGRKIAGAAQRKTRSGLLHQGSIQRENLTREFRHIFSKLLAKLLIEDEISGEAITAAEELAAIKYATENWLRRR